MSPVENKIKFTPSVDLEVGEVAEKLVPVAKVAVVLTLLYIISRYGFKTMTKGATK